MKQPTTSSDEEEQTERTTSAMVLSGYTFTLSITKNKEVVLRSEGLEVCMSPTEALLLSLALNHVYEEVQE
ncbi:hypothetical protein EVB68_049 [Rhizobium phage RHph_Y2_6]|uniref:Uncharacterized protein n=2 Tax=Acanvirus TaxID=3044653 RepID=A0AAE7VMK2_9CAUD|nr:hypothetical protein PP748_gp049 [Rhizobium phage RHph_Y2_6]YP_010658355.1 hypothetical protein PP750_gp45 [Rhizobium phage RHEph16]QIG68786.1 hypothetical protein EVB68_049 [Rhizobium phage RHph_Y2_6]QXV74354.1 hypothetical protein [Rhizobium phage RHEph16]